MNDISNIEDKMLKHQSIIIINIAMAITRVNDISNIEDKMLKHQSILIINIAIMAITQLMQMKIYHRKHRTIYIYTNISEKLAR